MKFFRFSIGFLLLFFFAACHSPHREARQMVYRAQQLFDTDPDSTVRLIDSVLRMPVYFEEGKRMDMALLQAEALFRDLPIDDSWAYASNNFYPTSELEHAAAYYAKKKDYAKAARAALFSGYAQQETNNKTASMQSFKEAEYYARLANDSLTMALSEYRMGRMLCYDYMEEEAIPILKTADRNFGNRLACKSFVQNAMAVAFMLQRQFDSAEICLSTSLSYANLGDSKEARLKAMNNYAVLYRHQGKFEQAIGYLKQAGKEPNLDDHTVLSLYLNLGSTFADMNVLDSATYYFQRVESLLPNANVKDETRVTAYKALSLFAESQGDEALALLYRKRYEQFLNKVRDNTEQRIVYGIQKKYDKEALQNVMKQRVIRRQLIIIIVSIVAVLGLVALTISRIRLAKIRKQEILAKTNLFHFMQQNHELSQKQEINEKALTDLSMMHESSKKAYQKLEQRNTELESTCNNYAQQLSDALNQIALTMRRLHIYLGNKGEKAYLASLKEAVFGDKDHWDALMEVFDALYPNVREELELQYPELTEMEQKDFILSYFGLSRDEEALFFNKSTHSVDKWRNGARKKMQKQSAESAQIP